MVDENIRKNTLLRAEEKIMKKLIKERNIYEVRGYINMGK